MILFKLSRYFHTIRYLRFNQIIWRLFKRFKVTDTSNQDVIAERKIKNNWHTIRLSKPHVIDELSFNFLNKKHTFSGSVDWNTNDQEMLWLFNLHYFDDLNTPIEYHRNLCIRMLVDDWIEFNPPMFGVGWEAYPLSLRIVNWIKCILNGEPAKSTWLNSIKLQANILSQNVEYHLYGNHILANAKALIFAGLFFQGKKAEKWLELGLKIYDTQLNEQILPDGGHFELSPMYQNIMLNDLLDLINLANTYSYFKVSKFLGDWRSKASDMLTWSKVMKHPDGEISFFNDAAFGIAPLHHELVSYAAEIGVETDSHQTPIIGTTEVTSLAQSGYLRVEQKNLVAILDCAAIGPDYLPGHGHADSLSFELSLQNFRVFVNAGTSCYGVSEERVRQRGTSAHNTVMINGFDSSQVWSGFRVAKRAYPFGLVVDKRVDGVNISCSHDGYKRLKNPVVHNRVWEFSQDSMTITDELTGDFITGETFYLFHPNIFISAIQDHFTLTLPSATEIVIKISGGEARLIDTFWNPEFGKSLPTKGLVVDAKSGKVGISITGYA